MRNNCSFRSPIVTHNKLKFTPIHMTFLGLDLAFSKAERNLHWMVLSFNNGRKQWKCEVLKNLYNNYKKCVMIIYMIWLYIFTSCCIWIILMACLALWNVIGYIWVIIGYSATSVGGYFNESLLKPFGTTYFEAGQAHYRAHKLRAKFYNEDLNSHLLTLTQLG